MLITQVCRWLALIAFGLSLGVSPGVGAPSAAEAEQLRIVQVMTAQMRARAGKLPVLIAKNQPLAEIEEQVVTLNRDPIVVEGQRFDGVVVTAPADTATFAWAFASPANVASWYILREQGDMKGFADFLRRPRASLTKAEHFKPENVSTITLQKLDSSAWVPGERHILWFRFKDSVPTEITLRAGFFAIPSLTNNRLPRLLFP